MPTWRDPGELEFDAVVTAAGTRTGAFVELPFDVERLFGTRGRVPVAAQVDGVTYRASLMAYDGAHLLALLRAVRRQTGKDIGDRVRVRLRLDADVSAVAPRA